MAWWWTRYFEIFDLYATVGTSSSLSQQTIENRSDSDDTYDEGNRTPQLFAQCELNDLVRDLNLPKDAA